MKVLKPLLILLAALCLSLTACSKTEPSVTPPAEPSAEPSAEASPAEISEKDMENFAKKLQAGDYTVTSPFVKISVPSKDLVWFDYAEELYHDFAVMSVNEEAFQAQLGDGNLGYASFLGEGNALDAASARLPNNWLTLSNGNLFEFFYNQIETPLTFVSHEETVKRTLLNFVGYGETALRLMEDVYMEMDSEDPTIVRLKAVVNDDPVARISFEDIDVLITLGDAEGNAAAEAWMAAPVYPKARTGWTDTDEFVLNSVFITTEGKEVLPFPSFASYAMKMDEENFVMEDAVHIRDSHATEEDLQEYIALLKQEGFQEAKETDEDGNEVTVYRRLLREDFNCYTSVELEYNNGVDMTARKYYDVPTYAGLDTINERLTALGYQALPASTNFVSILAEDRAVELTESWLYFFTYDANLYVNVEFDDRDKMQTYLDEYVQSLLDNGFHPVYTDDEETPEYYELDTGRVNFRYVFPSDNKVTMLFRAEKNIPAEEAEKMLVAAGFPEIDLNDPITCRDLTRFEKARYGKDDKLFLTVSQNYATTAEAEEFLNKYEEALNAQGFGRVSPDMAGSPKAIAICNEEKGMLVGIDFFEQQSGVLVNFDFEAE